MEIQKLILIDFTAALNGGIKKGSIDAILLSIEMIEKGFSSNSISSQETHTKLLQNYRITLKLYYSHMCVCVCVPSNHNQRKITQPPNLTQKDFHFYIFQAQTIVHHLGRISFKDNVLIFFRTQLFIKFLG